MADALQQVKDWYKGNHYPPVDEFDCVVDGEYIDDRRWGTTKRWVFKIDDQYVMVIDVEPATENQDWGDYGDPNISLVTPVEKQVVVTTWEPV